MLQPGARSGHSQPGTGFGVFAVAENTRQVLGVEPVGDPPRQLSEHDDAKPKRPAGSVTVTSPSSL
jgi:hypothetical protein